MLNIITNWLIVIFVSSLLFSVDFSQAKTITVGQDGGTSFTTIQAAIDAIDHGDVVIVQPGRYLENINFNGKNITLRSTEPTSSGIVESTIIDGNENGSVVTFSGTEEIICVLAGFTITNSGTSILIGGGIHGDGTSATIRYNIIEDNAASRGGGLSDCDGLIEHNVIRNNIGFTGGGGLYFCDGNIRHNSISNNGLPDDRINDSSFARIGGGLRECDALIENNIISNNIATLGGGLGLCQGTIQNNIIAGNFAVGITTLPGTHQRAFIGTGGGIASCHGTIQNNLIYNNQSDGERGGVSSCRGIIQNCVIYGNTCTNPFNDGLIGGASLCTLKNCILWGNTSDVTTRQITSQTTATFCVIQNWQPDHVFEDFEQSHIITSDPLFFDPRNEDFRLRPDSPCIDAGCTVPLTVDYCGLARPYNGTDEPRGDGSDIDIGAHEFRIYSDLIRDDILDTNIFNLSAFQSSQLDANDDGKTDVADLMHILRDESNCMNMPHVHW